MPDYIIKCWDGDSFDFDSIPFVKEAMAEKKYASASDYIRLYALYNHGGIYLDSDVLVKKPFDFFLNNEFFCGTEAYYVAKTLHFRMEAAIMGATKGHPFIKECMTYYQTNNFSIEYASGKIVMPDIISKFAHNYGYKYDNQEQIISDIRVFPTSFFTNTLHKDTSDPYNLYAIHQNAGSWIDYSDRGWLFRFCKKHDLMNIYHWIETIRK